MCFSIPFTLFEAAGNFEDDMNSSIALYLLRMGKPKEALNLINETVSVLEKNESDVRKNCTFQFG